MKDLKINKVKNYTMKSLLIISIFSFFGTALSAQNKNSAGTFEKNKKIILAEAACGQCKLGFKGESCDLAVRIHNKAYFVDGVHIDSLGNAHAKEGFCNAIRKAEVQGEIKDDRFVASYFNLLPTSAKGKRKK